MTSTFAPPTGPPVTATPHEISPVPVGAPTRRRRPLVLAAAVVAVVALGAVGIAALAVGRTGDRGEVAQPYSLAAAAQHAVTARTVEFEMSVAASGLAEFAVSGAVDNETGLMSITADLSSLLAMGDSPLPLGAEKVNMLFDASTATAYISADALAGLLPAPAGWVSIDLGAVAEMSGQSLDDIRGDMALEPTDVAGLLLDTDTAVEIGAETIDGVDTKHFQVTVDVAEALAALPGAGVDLADREIDLPDTVAYDVWVTADNQLRRVSFDTEFGGQAVSMQLDMTARDEPLGIELPDTADVFDITGFLGL